MKKYVAELIGTLVLVLMGCGSAVFAGNIAGTVGDGVGTLGVAFAFGLAVVAMAYTIGNISGCHINPAITLGVWLSGRMRTKRAMMYMLFQVVGGILGALLLSLLVATGAHEGQAFLAETVFTALFVWVVLGTTDEKKGAGNMAGLVIGLTLVLVHIVCIPITGTSVNPARSIGPALMEGGQAMGQLWLFIVAPMLGGAIAAGVWRFIKSEA